MLARSTTLALSLVTVTALAAPALAKRAPPPPPPTGPHISAVTKVVTAGCDTDGGAVTCSMGVKYMGTLLLSTWNTELESTQMACADAKPGTYTFTIGFEYNDGTMGIVDTDKARAKWPACVAPLADAMSAKWLEWFKVLQPIDPTIDVRNRYRVTIKISK
jgi:hypothetical protein